MKNKCFDIGMIQAFLDGELASDLSERVVKHAAACDECALMMSEAEEENAFAFAALDGELNVLVPTERLRTKVFTAIDEIEHERSIGWWQRLTESLGLADFDLRSPSFAALACTLLFVGTFALSLKMLPRMVALDEVALGEDLGRVTEAPIVSRTAKKADVKATTSDSADRSSSNTIVIARASRKRSRPRKLVYRPEVKTNVDGVKQVQPKAPKFGPAVEGEDIYLQTISTLNKSVDGNKDFTMRAKERIAFERNIAMVDNAIKKMKAEVRKNPSNKAAKDLLKSSYQNKIDLLNSVAERNELMASMQ